MAETKDDVDQMLAEFLIYYEANIAEESRPFPGAVAMLERLASCGAKLAVCTNKREHLSRKLLQSLELEGYFGALAGRDTFAVAKPDPGHLTGVITLAGGSPASAVMVGDSDIDIRTAQGAGVPSILVSFGYSPPPPGGPVPDAVIDRFEELEPNALALLRRLTTKAGAAP